MVMLGALGALTATLPAEFLIVSVGWRGLFELLAIVSAGCAVPSSTLSSQICRQRYRGRERQPPVV